MSVAVHHGDCVEVLAAMAAEGRLFDSVCCDPPYHLLSTVKRFGKVPRTESTMPKSEPHARMSRGFMGKTWDGGAVAFEPETWEAVFRVLKPGAHLIAFSGTRTYHRMVCAIEDAGFEIRDQLAWIYGSGFPKSHNQPGGWGTALKPAWEPIVLARRPLIGTVAVNLLQHGTGAINIDGCRVETDENLNGGCHSPNAKPRAMAPGGASRNATAGEYAQPLGRWPANLCHDGSEEVLAGFPAEANGGHHPAARGRGGIGNDGHQGQDGLAERSSDSGSAARFFYSAKAGPLDRLGSAHPTVKPVDLMRWLCRLVTPPGGTVLDPFAGSGSTGIAAMAEGFNAELIDIEAEHVADIRRKLAILDGDGAHMLTELHRNRTQKPLGGLFAEGGAAA